MEYGVIVSAVVTLPCLILSLLPALTCWTGLPAKVTCL